MRVKVEVTKADIKKRQRKCSNCPVAHGIHRSLSELLPIPMRVFVDATGRTTLTESIWWLGLGSDVRLPKRAKDFIQAYDANRVGCLVAKSAKLKPFSFTINV